jgi:hypothetical protein
MLSADRHLKLCVAVLYPKISICPPKKTILQLRVATSLICSHPSYLKMLCFPSIISQNFQSVLLYYPSHKLETQITEAMVPISLVLLLVQSSYVPIPTAGKIFVHN